MDSAILFAILSERTEKLRYQQEIFLPLAPEGWDLFLTRHKRKEKGHRKQNQGHSKDGARVGFVVTKQSRNVLEDIYGGIK